MSCKDSNFIAWVRAEALHIGSDGCSHVPDFHKDACLAHDLAYWYAKDPRSAYNIMSSGATDYWQTARPISKADADTLLKDCIRADSKFGRFSPMALWRYWAVKQFGSKAWHSHASTHIPSEVK